VKIEELENAEPVRYNRPWTEHEEDVLKEYYPLPKALPVTKLAKHLGRSKVAVMRKIAHMGIKRTS